MADTWILKLVKPKAGQQIPIGRPRNSDLHLARRLSDFLATSQSMNSSFPARTRASVARSSRRCHIGESKRSSFFVRSAHNSSMARNFSTLVIDLIGRVVGITENLGMSPTVRKD